MKATHSRLITDNGWQEFFVKIVLLGRIANSIEITGATRNRKRLTIYFQTLIRKRLPARGRDVVSSEGNRGALVSCPGEHGPSRESLT